MYQTLLLAYRKFQCSKWETDKKRGGRKKERKMERGGREGEGEAGGGYLRAANRGESPLFQSKGGQSPSSIPRMASTGLPDLPLSPSLPPSSLPLSPFSSFPPTLFYHVSSGTPWGLYWTMPLADHSRPHYQHNQGWLEPYAFSKELSMLKTCTEDQSTAIKV